MADLNRGHYSSVEEILETGVLDTWYLVARDSEIDTGPVGLTRLSRDIVLWRDPDRKLHCVEDFCPHRGAKLSLGMVCDGNVACAYHGVQVNGAGEIAAVPTESNSPCIGQKAKRHPSQSFTRFDGPAVMWTVSWARRVSACWRFPIASAQRK